MLRSMEGRTEEILFRSALVLLLAAATLYAVYDYLFSGIEWTPLGIPIELVEGREHEGDFIAAWSVVYEVRIDTDRGLELQAQNCLLGIETVAPERCAGVPPELMVSWRVEADGEAIAGGESESSMGYWGPSMGKILGAFQAVEGRRYRVAASVAGSSTELQRTNPRLQVTVSPRERKWTYVWSGLLIVLASALLLLAIVSLVLLARRASLRRRR